MINLINFLGEYALIVFLLIGLILTLRTIFWHLQSWQLREYRTDRMKAYLSTNDGKKNVFNFIFFKGILPRPAFTGRIFMIIGIFILLYIFVLQEVIYFLSDIFVINHWIIVDERFGILLPPIFWISVVFIMERLIFLLTYLAVLISRFPVFLARKKLFDDARNIIRTEDNNIIRVMITGSYGKSSTKEILVHLLQKEFGKERVLFTPENNNTEVAIARMILKNKHFFQSHHKARNPKELLEEIEDEDISKFLIVEAGAYKRKEIAQICYFIEPHIGILTGLNQQHLSNFGSFENIKNTKFELAEWATEKVFFNADNEFLQEIFNDRDIQAVKIPISSKVVKNLKSDHKGSDFEVYGRKMHLPWPGSFFVQNALLAIECARELGADVKNISKNLKTLKPLKKALNIYQHKNEFYVLRDVYAANPDGVLSAINHLKNFSGKKVFMSVPLLELGKEAESVHIQIFEALKALNCEVYWLKDDFKDLGKKILGKNFHDMKHKKVHMAKMIKKSLKKDDVILLESKIPENILKIFE